MTTTGESKGSWTTHDLMAVIVALMTGTTFQVGSNAWTAAGKKIADTDFGKRELANLWFEDLGPYGYRCTEVDTFLTTLRRSEILHVLAPRFQTCLIDESSKQSILAGNPEILERFGPELKDLAARLAADLSPERVLPR